MNGFGDFLYTLRKEKGMTQAELAEALGITNKAVSKWETGEAMPETSLLLPLSRIFDVSVDELLDGKRAQQDEPEDEQFVPEKHLFTRGKDDEKKSLLDIIGGTICASIMLIGIATYLLIGTFAGAWTPYWIILPVCALSCGILGIVFDLFNKDKREQKLKRGENPYTGAICGILILTCVMVYLILGVFTNLWHPLWIIVVIGALACGIIGALGEILQYSKTKK